MTDARFSVDNDEIQTGSTAFFKMVCIWSFVLLARPQDIFPVLSSLRPALLTSFLVVVFYIFNFSQLRGSSFSQERLLRYFFFLVFIMVLGIPFSLYPRLSFMIVFTQYIMVIFFVIVFYKLVDSEEKLLTIMLLGCLGNGLYSIFSMVNGSYLNTGRLSFGTMFDPNDQAYFIMAFLPLNLLFTSRENPLWIRLCCLGSFGMGSIVILLSGSRGGMLAFCSVGVMLFFGKTSVIRFPFKLALVCVGMLLFFNMNVSMDRYLTLFSIEDDYNVSSETGRLAIWSIGVRAMLENPVTGVGLGCFAEAVGNDRKQRASETLRWQSAHNSIIQIGTETGLLGFWGFILMNFHVFRIFLRVRKRTDQEKLKPIAEMGLVGFTGVFVAGMFLSQAYSIYWAFYMVVAAVINQLSIRQDNLSST